MIIQPLTGFSDSFTAIYNYTMKTKKQIEDARSLMQYRLYGPGSKKPFNPTEDVLNVQEKAEVEDIYRETNKLYEAIQVLARDIEDLNDRAKRLNMAMKFR